MHHGSNNRNRDHLSTDQQDNSGEVMSGEVNMENRDNKSTGNKFSPGRADSGEL